MTIEQLMPLLKIQTVEEKPTVGVFVFEPLPTGYGHTLGNALRRVLISSLPGAAVTQFRVEGVNHQFSTVPGVKEDMVQLSLNLKKIRLRIFDSNPVTLKLDEKGPKEVTAGDLEVLGNAEVTNKDLHLASLADNKTKLLMELNAESGVGYVPCEERPTNKIGVISLDCAFSPVASATYTVDPTRVGRETDLDKLTIEITTDGTTTPPEALKKSAYILLEYLKFISGEKVIEPTPVSEAKAETLALSEAEKKMPVDDLGLSTRTTNALLSGKIKTLEDLLSKNSEDLMKLRGFGQKAVSEVEKLLKKQGWR